MNEFTRCNCQFPPLPLIGEPARLQAKYEKNHPVMPKEEYTFEELENQREAVDAYGGFAIFDTHGEASDMCVRDGMFCCVVSESRSADPFENGTMWVIEFEDGYVTQAYFDELNGIEGYDVSLPFGSPLIFDARKYVYQAAQSLFSIYCEDREDPKDMDKILNSSFDDLLADIKEKCIETAKSEYEFKRGLMTAKHASVEEEKMIETTEPEILDKEENIETEKTVALSETETVINETTTPENHEDAPSGFPSDLSEEDESQGEEAVKTEDEGAQNGSEELTEENAENASEQKK